MHYKKYANPVAHIEYIGDRQRSAVIKAFESGDRYLRGLSFSPDGTRNVSTSEGDEVCIWDAASGKLTTALDYTADRIALSPSGNLVELAYSEEEEGGIAVWSPIGGEVV